MKGDGKKKETGTRKRTQSEKNERTYPEHEHLWRLLQRGWIVTS